MIKQKCIFFSLIILIIDNLERIFFILINKTISIDIIRKQLKKTKINF